MKLATGVAALLLVSCAATQVATRTFTVEDFGHLRFLEGRWTGQAPDGSAFHEEYDFPDATTMRSRRFADASFSSATDGSTVSLEGGRIVSRWGDFVWEATSAGPQEISFAPVNAPGHFSWRLTDADSVAVTQRWRDESGVERTYIVPLEKIGSGQPGR
jgi:hypothetical protein